MAARVPKGRLSFRAETVIEELTNFTQWPTRQCHVILLCHVFAKTSYPYPLRSKCQASTNFY